MNYLKQFLIENAAADSLDQHLAAWQALPEAGREPLHRYLGLTAAELDLYRRDPAFFFKYLARMKATRQGGCGSSGNASRC